MNQEERKQRAIKLGVRVCDLDYQELLQTTLTLSKQSDLQSASTIAILNASVVETKLSVDENSTDALTIGHFIESSNPLPFVKDVQEQTGSAQMEAGPWIRLPIEVVDKILVYLGDPDMVGYLMVASKSVFQPSERVYKFLCEFIYPRQTVKKCVVLERWKSWQHMLINRPRLRTNGFYSLRYRLHPSTHSWRLMP
jgi:hypothetical protein